MVCGDVPSNGSLKCRDGSKNRRPSLPEAASAQGTGNTITKRRYSDGAGDQVRSLREPRFVAVTRIPKTILCARKLWKRATDHQDVVKDLGDELQEIKKERMKE